MRLYLESVDLFEHAEGLAVASSGRGESGDALLRNFNSPAKKAWTYICLAVEPEQQIHVRHKNRKESLNWDALKSQFTRGSILQKVRLHQQ